MSKQNVWAGIAGLALTGLAVGLAKLSEQPEELLVPETPVPLKNDGWDGPNIVYRVENFRMFERIWRPVPSLFMFGNGEGQGGANRIGDNLMQVEQLGKDLLHIKTYESGIAILLILRQSLPNEQLRLVRVVTELEIVFE